MTFIAKLLLLLAHLEGLLCRIRTQHPHIEREMCRARARHLRSLMGACGENLRIGQGVRFLNPEHLYLGENVYIGPGSRVDVICPASGESLVPRLEIGNNVSLEANCHVACAKKVSIEDDVMIAAHVFISDHNHCYEDVGAPVKSQGVVVPADVIIGRDSWIGEGACVLAGASVGEHCVIGANGVVTTSIPSFTVAVGIPTRPVRKFDHHDRRWKKI